MKIEKKRQRDKMRSDKRLKKGSKNKKGGTLRNVVKNLHDLEAGSNEKSKVTLGLNHDKGESAGARKQRWLGGGQGKAKNRIPLEVISICIA